MPNRKGIAINNTISSTQRNITNSKVKRSSSYGEDKQLTSSRKTLHTPQKLQTKRTAGDTVILPVVLPLS